MKTWIIVLCATIMNISVYGQSNQNQEKPLDQIQEEIKDAKPKTVNEIFVPVVSKGKTLDKSTQDLVQDLKKAFESLMRNYEGESLPGIQKIVSRDVRTADTTNNRLNFSQLMRAFKDEFAIFSGIRFEIFVRAFRVNKDFTTGRYEIRWNRRAQIASDADQEWITRNQTTLLTFVREGTQWKLRLIEGDPFIGICDFRGNMIIDRGTLDGNVITAANAVTISPFGNANGGGNNTVTLISTENIGGGIFLFQQVDLNNGNVSGLGLAELVKADNFALTSVFANQVFVEILGGGANQSLGINAANAVGTVIEQINGFRLLVPVEIIALTIEDLGGGTLRATMIIRF